MAAPAADNLSFIYKLADFEKNIAQRKKTKKQEEKKELSSIAQDMRCSFWPSFNAFYYKQSAIKIWWKNTWKGKHAREY